MKNIIEIEHNEKYFALKFKIGIQEYAMLSKLGKGLRFVTNDVTCKKDFNLICGQCFFEKLKEYLASKNLLHKHNE